MTGIVCCLSAFGESFAKCTFSFSNVCISFFNGGDVGQQYVVKEVLTPSRNAMKAHQL